MIDYGGGPAENEIEVCIFGPGYGEAIAIHFGSRKWVLFDSCIDPNVRRPASLHYLQSIQPANHDVLAIVATHWHDDHVRGLAEVASAYPAVPFFLPGVFNNKEALAFLAAYSGNHAPGQTGGSRELFSVIHARDIETIRFVSQRVAILDQRINGLRAEIVALSPTSGANAQALAHLASYLPNNAAWGAINHAPALTPNCEAIAAHVSFGSDHLLLGADLEDHQHGWSSIVQDAWCLDKPKATVYKVAHHGSPTACIPRIWTDLLEPNPISCLTPFNRGRTKLPGEQDRDRILAYTNQAYISSKRSRAPTLEREIVKAVSVVAKTLQRSNSGFGVIRLRKDVATAQSWRVEKLGHADDL